VRQASLALVLTSPALAWLLAGAAAATESSSRPRITHFGIASASERPVAPEPVEESGRRVYPWPQGHGFSLVIEAGVGPDLRPVGASTFSYDADDPSVLPDLQVLVSNGLGSGNPAVCETGDGDVGIPAVPSLVFSESAQVSAAINDLGCRFDDGAGRFAGRERGEDACTRSPITQDPGFVGGGSTVQFCAFIARPLAFAGGDTIVAARVRDTVGRLSEVEEIVIRITGFNPTPTETRPTATPVTSPSQTPIRTPTPTKTPAPSCVGDCDNDGKVIVSELLTSVSIAFGVLPLSACRSIDADRDGKAAIHELAAAVAALLQDCPSR
jgi:hypothetical protein